MRVLIVSDTHGNHENLELVLKRERKFDLMIHLGDSETSLRELNALVDCPIHIVAGNMDRDSLLPLEKIIEVEGYRIMICHGHRANVNAGLLRLEYMAREQEVDLVMYGHTHVPYLDVADDLTIVNPGSLSYPRPWGARPSYAVMTTDGDGVFEIAHYNL